jgi:hypothetical protein
MSEVCTHSDLVEHPDGLVCRGCGEVIDRARGETAASAREAARREQVALHIAAAREALAGKRPAGAAQDRPGGPASPSPCAPDPETADGPHSAPEEPAR